MIRITCMYHGWTEASFRKKIRLSHNDIDNCEKQLQRATKLTEESGGGILVITKVYSAWQAI